MRTLFFILLTASLSVASLCHAQDLEPGEIHGVVISAETGKPLQGAHVFLSGTKTGTVTGPSGRFQIQNIQPGIYDLVISILGYKRITDRHRIAPESSLIVNTEMQPVVYEMGELYVGNLDDRWQRYFERFEKLFIGESSRAAEVTILNPEVLRFESRWWGRFSAEALAPLQIENRALGYRITYHLDEFYHVGEQTRWDGDPLFTELTPVDEKEAERWKQNRETAFYGSVRHFYLSLINDRLEKEGFLVYRRPTHSLTQPTGSSRNRANTSRLVRPSGEDYLWHLSFSGLLEVIHTESELDPNYEEWQRRNHHRDRGSRSSFIELNKPYVTIDSDGETEEIYGTTRYGYYSFLRVADITPRDYRPEGFQLNSGKINE